MLALLHRVLALELTPFVDMAVRTPSCQKSMQANKFRTWTPGMNGTWIPKEAPGPENHEQWLLPRRDFVSAELMLGICTRPPLEADELCIEKLRRLWPKAGHLIYVAGDMMRSEALERTRREIAQRIASGGVAPHGYDPAAPGTACLFTAVVGKLDHKDSWAEQVHQPAAEWSAKGGRGVALSPEEEPRAWAFSPGPRTIRIHLRSRRCRGRSGPTPGSTAPRGTAPTRATSR